MTDRTQIFPTRSKNVGFAFNRQVLAHRLACEFAQCEAGGRERHQTRSKEGRVDKQKSEAQIRITILD